MRSGKKKRTSRPSLLVKTLRFITSFCFLDFLTQLLRVKRNTILNAVALAFFLLSYLLCFCCSSFFFSRLNRTCFPIFSFLFVYSFIPSLIARSVGAFPYPSFFFRFCFSLHFKPTDWTLLLLKSRLNGLAFNRRHSLFFVVLRHFFFLNTANCYGTKRP